MRILCLCNGNVFRSQLAEFFLRKRGFDAASAAITDRSFHGKYLYEIFEDYPGIKELLEEYGFDFDRTSKRLTGKMADKADVVIAVLEDRKLIPDFVDREKLVFWEIEDGVDSEGKLKSLDIHRSIIEKIKELANQFKI